MPRFLTDLAPFERDTKDVSAVVETPRGHRSKLKYDPKRGIFLLHRTLPEGVVFPYDFGFIPSTGGEDGDPVDVLILMDEAQFPGCVVPIRLVGVIEADQIEPNGERVENDRLIGVSTSSVQYHDIRELTDLPAMLVAQVEAFFRVSAEASGKTFLPKGRKGAARARSLLSQGMKRGRSQRAPKKRRQGRTTR